MHNTGSTSFTERRRHTISKGVPPTLQLNNLAPPKGFDMLVVTSSPETALSPLLMSSINAFPQPPACSFAPAHEPPSSVFDRKRGSSLPGILQEWAQLSDEEEEDADQPSELSKVANRTLRESVRVSISTTGSTASRYFEASEELDVDWLRRLAKESLKATEPGQSWPARQFQPDVGQNSTSLCQSLLQAVVLATTVCFRVARSLLQQRLFDDSPVLFSLTQTIRRIGMLGSGTLDWFSWLALAKSKDGEATGVRYSQTISRVLLVLVDILQTPDSDL
jgi:hypothetical protein